MNEKPPMEEIIAWIDVETLLLLFGMMILVAILAQTGVFDYLAVYAFKVFSNKTQQTLLVIISYLISDHQWKGLAAYHLPLLLHCDDIIGLR